MRALLIPIMLVLSVSGCAALQPAPPRVAISVDAIAVTPVPAARRYVLESAMPTVPDTDLQFREFANQLARGLRDRGYVRVEDPATAELRVTLEYGISGPQEQHITEHRPMLAQPPLVMGGFGHIGPRGHWLGVGGYSPFTVVDVPVTRTLTRYQRVMVVTAYPRTSDPRVPSLWRTTVTSTGSRGDLRWVFPYLVYAAVPYFANHTGTRQDVSVVEEDAEVELIRQHARPVLPPGMAAEASSPARSGGAEVPAEPKPAGQAVPVR